MRALALRTPAWAMRWLIRSWAVLRVTLPGSGGFLRGGMVVFVAAGSAVGALVRIWRRSKSLPWVPGPARRSPPLRPASQAVGDAGGPADGGLVDALVDQQLGGAQGQRVARAPAPGVDDLAGSAGAAGASEAAAGALVMPGPSSGGPTE